MDDHMCRWCGLVEPTRGYVCAYCVFDRLKQIRNMEDGEAQLALEALDREQYGFVMSAEEHLRAAEEGLERLRATLGRMGVGVEQSDE